MESKLRQAAIKQKQAVDRYNRELRHAVNDYNRAVSTHNARIRSNRQKLEQALRRFRSASTARTFRVTLSAQSVHTAFVRVAERQRVGTVYPEDLFGLFEDETANSLRAANALDGNDEAQADEIAALQSTTLAGELEAFSSDLASRWGAPSSR